MNLVLVFAAALAVVYAAAAICLYFGFKKKLSL